jgi:cytochrome bd ubiquinol oxidase subunit II
LLNVRNWLLGLAVFFLARTLAALFFVNRIKHEILEIKSRKAVLFNALPFLVFFLSFVIWTMLAEGFAVNPETGEVYMEKYKYFFNLIQMPAVLISFLIGVVGVLWGIGGTVFSEKFKSGIWFAGIGTILTVCSLLLLAGYNNTAYYPSINLQSSLTIFNSSSSEFTLNAMTIVSVLIPFVLAYIFYAWRSMEKNRTDMDDINNDGHAY